MRFTNLSIAKKYFNENISILMQEFTLCIFWFL